MSQIRFSGLLSFAVTLSVVHAEPRCPGNVASLTLRLVQGALIVVPVEINQSGPYDFIVDTGAQITTIDTTLASELRLKLQGATGVGGIATSTRSAFAYLDLLQAGTHAVANSLVVIQDLAQLKATDSRIRGILGENFLAHFDLLIDNRQRILCLDDSDALARAVKGEHIALEEPKGGNEDLPFTRPIIVSARLSGLVSGPSATSVLLRLDSGSNAPVLYDDDMRLRNTSIAGSSLLNRVVSSVEQRFAVLPPQDIRVGSHLVRQVSFVMPMNSIGSKPTLREDGLLPTVAFQRVFISYHDSYTVLDPW